MEKVDEITPEELTSGWRIFRDLTKKEPTFFIGNSALSFLKKSGSLVGQSFNTVVYMPHKYNLNTKSVEIFKGDFLVGGLDPNIKPPDYLVEELKLLQS